MYICVFQIQTHTPKTQSAIAYYSPWSCIVFLTNLLIRTDINMFLVFNVKSKFSKIKAIGANEIGKSAYSFDRF